MTPFLEYLAGDTKFSFENGLVGFEYTSCIESRARTHRAFVAGSSYKDVELRSLQKDCDIAFRFGFSGGQVSVSHRHKLFGYDISLINTGINFAISGADRSLEIARGVKNRGFMSMTVSQIVRAIAANNKLKAEIEETRGEYSLRQIWVSDMRFMVEELLPRAISAETGRADYDVYLDQANVLHFHTPRYSNTIFKRYEYGKSRIREIGFSFCGEEANSLGGLSSEAHGYDPLAKRSLGFTASDETTKEKELLGKKTFLTDLPARADCGRFYHGTQGESVSQVQAEAKSHFYHAQRSRYKGSLLIDGEPGLEAGAVISLAIPTANGHHFLSGRYLVLTAKHILNQTAYLTKALIVRNGALEGEDELTGVVRKQIDESDESVIIRESSRL